MADIIIFSIGIFLGHYLAKNSIQINVGKNSNDT